MWSCQELAILIFCGVDVVVQIVDGARPLIVQAIHTSI